MLSILDHRAEVTLLLGGDLNAGFRRLKKATEETLEELAVYADIRVKDGWSAAQENGLMDSLGLRPIVIHEREQNGKTAQTSLSVRNHRVQWTPCGGDASQEHPRSQRRREPECQH